MFVVRKALSAEHNTRRGFLIKHCIGFFCCSENTVQKSHFFCVPTPFGTRKTILMFLRFHPYYWNNRHPTSKHGFSGNIRARYCFIGEVQYLILSCSVPESRKYNPPHSLCIGSLSVCCYNEIIK